MDLKEAMGAAKACVHEFLQLRPKENLVIVGDTATDSTVLESLRVAAMEAGGEVVTIILSLSTKPSRTTWDGPPAVNAAIREANAYIILGFPIVSFQSRFAAEVMFEHYGIRRLLVDNPFPAVWTGKRMQPVNLRLRSDIGLHIFNKLREEEEIRIRITDPKGTDVSTVVDCQAMHANAIIGFPNFSGIIPGGEIGFTDGSAMRPGMANGSICWDEVMGLGWMNPPMTWHLKDGMLVDIGGPKEEVQILADYLDRFPRGREFHEISFGFDPWVEWTRPTVEATHLDIIDAVGCAHMCVGNQKLKSCGTKWSNVHVDGCLLAPTVTINDRVFIKDGRMVPEYIEDPEIRRIAEKYGDPDELLKLPERPYRVDSYGKSVADSGHPGL
jgi:hypothetical protein